MTEINNGKVANHSKHFISQPDTCNLCRENDEEEMKEHLEHILRPQPSTCDLCWLDAPLTDEEAEAFRIAEEKISIDW